MTNMLLRGASMLRVRPLAAPRLGLLPRLIGAIAWAALVTGTPCLAHAPHPGATDAPPTVERSPGAAAPAIPGSHSTTALDELQAKAAAGDPEAQYELGVRYSTGKGVSLDREKALEWYTASAEQGYPKAAHELARHYKGLTGGPQDLEKAYAYTRKAAEHGHVPAQVDLASCTSMAATRSTRTCPPPSSGSSAQRTADP
jgi:hypothetical protein